MLASSLALIALFALWQPLGGVVWTVDDPTIAACSGGRFAFGWLLVLVSTFLINTSTVRLAPGLAAVGDGLYTSFRSVRRTVPLRSTRCTWVGSSHSGRPPTMTVSHLVFALMTTAYILVAIQLEERDLVAHFGDAYRGYKKRVPMLIPFVRRNRT